MGANKPDIHTVSEIIPPFSWRRWLFIALLALIALAAYHNSFQLPYIFDDISSIRDNKSIQNWGTALTSGATNGETVGGRPVLNLTFAVNYKISGMDVWSYHVGNLLIHILAGLVLFGLVRRTLLLPSMRGRFGADSFWIAWLVAALWLAHPLATESVTYIVQRAESLMALWYLLTLYCFIRSFQFSVFSFQLGAAAPKANSRGSAPLKTENCKLKTHLWLAASVFSCLLGMATKEVMVSAPLMVFFYDRTFISGAFREAWRLRRRWYIAYALTWIVLIALMIVNAGRGETVGFGRNISGITAWNYALTQSWAIIRYLQLSIWPSPLVFDYGINPIASLLEVLPQAVAVLALVAACFWAFFGKHPKAGWLGMLFLAVLAPTTTFIPVVTQVIAEHRMYLPLTAIVTGAVILGARFLGRKILWLGAPVVIIFIVLTIQRNVTYQGLDTLWLDVMAKYPKNARAYGNVGNNLIKAKRPEEALPYLKKALELQPQSGDYYNNVGYAYAQMRDYQKAVEYYSQVRNMTNLSTLGINYSFALTQLGRYAEAHHVARLLIKEHPERATSHAAEADIFFAEKNYAEAEPLYKKTLELDPTNATALNNLGNIKAAVTTPGHLAEALEYYKKAAQYAPDDATIQDNPARLLTMLGRGAEAVPYYEAELKAQPDATDARKGYAGALYDAGRYDDAAAQYKLYLQASPSDVAFVGRQAVDLMKSGQYAQALPIIQAMSDAVPNNVSNEFLLANNLMMLGRREDSLPHYQTALALAPSRVEIRQNYALALASAGRYADAIPQYEEVLKLAQLADQPYIRHNYALALEGAGRVDDAIAQEQEALRVNPNYEDAKKKLAELETRLKR